MKSSFINANRAVPGLLVQVLHGLHHGASGLEAVGLQVPQRHGTGGREHGEKRVYKPLPLLHAHAMDPASEFEIAEVGLAGHLPQCHKMVSHNLPGKAVVLEKPQLVAVHHGIGLLMLQQHPHH